MKGKKWASRFEASCRDWQTRLGLNDWAFRFRVKRGDDTKAAEVDMDRDAREAVFTAYTRGKHVDTPERVALHEVLHVVLNEMQEVAALRGNHEHKDVEIEEHRAIERLVNMIDGRP